MLFAGNMFIGQHIKIYQNSYCRFCNKIFYKSILIKDNSMTQLSYQNQLSDFLLPIKQFKHQLQLSLKMHTHKISFLTLQIPTNTNYEKLKTKLQFPQDTIGASNWSMNFPLVIYTSNLKQKHIFQENSVVVQKFQMGSIVNPQTADPDLIINLDIKWNYFVTTNREGKKYYCTSQMFYEKSHLRNNISSIFSTTEYTLQYYVPKCIVLYSEAPYFKLHLNMLKIYQQLRKKHPSISCSINQEYYSIYQQLMKDDKENEWNALQLRQIPQQKKKMAIKCSIENVFSYYVENCNNHNNGQAIFLEKTNNKQVLHLFILNDTLYQFSYYFHFNLNPKTLRIALSAILQEKQILFVSTNSNLTVMVIQTLMQMILPFKWQNLYIPILSESLLKFAEQCFMPYIIGVEPHLLKQINCSERIIIDIDKDSYTLYTELYQLPEHYEKYFNIKASDKKSYLDFQREIRINSLNFIVDLLSQNSYGDQLLHLTKQQKESYISGSKNKQFYEQLIKNTMMFEVLTKNRKNPMYRELVELLYLRPIQRKNLIKYRFNIIKQRAEQPILFDNEKTWIVYYHKQHMANRKKKFSFLTKKIENAEKCRQNKPLYYSKVIQKSKFTLNSIEPHQDWESKNKTSKYGQSSVSTQFSNSFMNKNSIDF